MRSQHWQTTGWRTRLVAGGVSLTLVVAMLQILCGSPVAPLPGLPPAAMPLWLTPVAPPPYRPASTIDRPSKKRALQRRTAPPEPISSARFAPAQTPIARAEPSLPKPALAASAPASAPLRLDDRITRRAIAGTDGAVRKLARSVGAELDSDRPTPTARLGSAIAEGAIPDCLAPNAGGSLLSAPIIVVQAMRGKCK